MSLSSPSLAHSPYEDTLAFVIGTLFVALGLTVLKAAGLGVGSTAGIAFLVYLTTHADFGTVFFLINVPVFVFAYVTLGRAYLVRSVLATGLLSLEASLLPRLFTIGHVEPIFAAMLGGLLCGMGMLALVRHRAGVGGFMMVAVFLQERYGWRAGRVLMVADAVVVGAAFLLMEPLHVALSIVATLCLNLVLALYHKPGRYAGF